MCPRYGRQEFLKSKPFLRFAVSVQGEMINTYGHENNAIGNEARLIQALPSRGVGESFAAFQSEKSMLLLVMPKAGTAELILQPLLPEGLR